jgi:hypothetical protein
MYGGVSVYVLPFRNLEFKYVILVFPDDEHVLLSVLLSCMHNMERSLLKAKSSQETLMTHLCYIASFLSSLGRLFPILP